MAAERCPGLERSSPKRSELSLHGDTVSGLVGFQIVVHSTAECQLWPLWRVSKLVRAVLGVKTRHQGFVLSAAHI